MPEHKSPRYSLSQGWLRGEDWWGDPVTRNFLVIDALLFGYVLSMSLTTPPEFNTYGDMYVVASGGTGPWAAHDGELTILTENGWLFIPPRAGLRIRLADPQQWMFFDPGTLAWQKEDFIGTGIPLQGTRYDLAMSVTFEAEPREVLMTFTPPQAMTLRAGGQGCYARCMTPPLYDLRISIRRDNVEVGTLTFPADSMVGQFSVAIDTLYTTANILSLHMPDAPPPGFINYNATLRMILAPTETP